MVKMSAKPPVAQATTPPINPNPFQMDTRNDQTPNEQEYSSPAAYEQCREERIKENRERMQKLGILDISLKLKSLNSNTTPRNRNRKTPQHITPLPPSGPTRRSSRLQNSTPVSYAENQQSSKDMADNSSSSWFLEEGSKPEIYTEEHEKLLGDTNMSWTLFVDGYGKDGKRIYDPVRGKTCHQCRQKTLGHRTYCSQCNLVQGQFCGDCLYMRYGENVLEANQNPNWICPPCRGICNCSLCRHAKGWAPTGILYKKITNLGFKSVAHYLIQTQRSDTTCVGKSSGTKVPLAAKRSLPFSDMEATSNASPDANNGLQGFDMAKSEDNLKDVKVVPVSSDHEGLSSPSSEDKANDSSVMTEKKEDMLYLDEKIYDKNIECESGIELIKEIQVTPVTTDVLLGKLNDEENKADGEFKREKEDNKPCDGYGTVESTPRSKKKCSLITEPPPDSIAGRLRLRRGKVCEQVKLELVQMNEQNLSSEESENVSGSAANSPQVDSIAGRLRQRRKCT